MSKKQTAARRQKKARVYRRQNVVLPNCPKCGNSSTSFHPDSESGREILICMACGHIGER